jgi:VWFA-related protein
MRLDKWGRRIGTIVLLALFLGGLAIAARTWAQEASTISVNVNVVSLLATVHDKDGRAVKDLTRSDFALLEDGAPQTIRYFSQESDLPLTIGLLVDTSRSQTGVLETERRASQAFLDQVLHQDTDYAFVVQFDTRVEILQGLTSSRADLASALDRLRIPGEYATLIYSAVRESSEGVMRKQQGRKAFILLTDGVAFRDSTSIETAIEFAQRADTIIYAIRFSDRIPVRRPVRAAVLAAASQRGKDGLQRMARETGGVAYEVTKNETIDSIYSQIEDTLRSQYSIGYTPERPVGDGKYRKVKLTTKDRRLTVNTRNGYYAK